MPTDSGADQAGLYGSTNQKEESQITSYFSGTTLDERILGPCPLSSKRGRSPRRPASADGNTLRVQRLPTQERAPATTFSGGEAVANNATRAGEMMS